MQKVPTIIQYSFVILKHEIISDLWMENISINIIKAVPLIYSPNIISNKCAIE